MPAGGKAKPQLDLVPAISAACAAQRCLAEAVEGLGGYQTPFLAEADVQLAEAMRSIARARSAVQEAIRLRDGLTTIREVG